jgi:ubiquinone/menaquinone biosynthesis C-methylase UbiE
MSNIFNFKTVMMTPLIKWAIRHPGLMESKIFLRAMIVFPEKISYSYDSKAKESDIDYLLAFKDGLTQISNTPQSILDLCTGTGLAAFMVADRFPLASIVGLDQSHSMVDIAQGKIPDADKKRIRFEIGNAADLSYGDAEFDLIVTSNAPVYLSEAARVLKPDGNILVMFSFGGKAFENARGEIIRLLEKNELSLVDLKSSGKGAFILGRKKLKQENSQVKRKKVSNHGL